MAVEGLPPAPTSTGAHAVLCDAASTWLHVCNLAREAPLPGAVGRHAFFHGMGTGMGALTRRSRCQCRQGSHVDPRKGDLLDPRVVTCMGLTWVSWAPGPSDFSGLLTRKQYGIVAYLAPSVLMICSVPQYWCGSTVCDCMCACTQGQAIPVSSHQLGHAFVAPFPTMHPADSLVPLQPRRVRYPWGAVGTAIAAALLLPTGGLGSGLIVPYSTWVRQLAIGPITYRPGCGELTTMATESVAKAHPSPLRACLGARSLGRTRHACYTIKAGTLWGPCTRRAFAGASKSSRRRHTQTRTRAAARPVVNKRVCGGECQHAQGHWPKQRKLRTRRV